MSVARIGWCPDRRSGFEPNGAASKGREDIIDLILAEPVKSLHVRPQENAPVLGEQLRREHER